MTQEHSHPCHRMGYLIRGINTPGQAARVEHVAEPGAHRPTGQNGTGATRWIRMGLSDDTLNESRTPIFTNPGGHHGRQILDTGHHQLSVKKGRQLHARNPAKSIVYSRTRPV